MDELLLERVVARDERALAELYDRHAGVVLGLLMRILRDRADAEDVLQEVFLRIWQKAESYDPVFGAPRPWLIRIARNCAVDRLRRRGSAQQTADAASSAEIISDAPRPDDSAIATERRTALDVAFRNVDVDDRTLIEHAYYLGYTQAELAAMFQLPLGTVKTRIRRGMQTMRAHLTKVE